MLPLEESKREYMKTTPLRSLCMYLLFTMKWKKPRIFNINIWLNTNIQWCVLCYNSSTMCLTALPRSLFRHHFHLSSSATPTSTNDTRMYSYAPYWHHSESWLHHLHLLVYAPKARHKACMQPSLLEYDRVYRQISWCTPPSALDSIPWVLLTVSDECVQWYQGMELQAHSCSPFH